MDSIKHAVELARAAAPTISPLVGAAPAGGRNDGRDGLDSHIRDVRLSAEDLEKARVVAHGARDHGRYYDMLRTQILQEMDNKSWQFLAVTSPTPGSGKSVTACNLAMSIARLPERSVLLVDLDLRKPTIANYLGLDEGSGILDVLEGRASLSDASLQANVGPSSIFVLPGFTSSSQSSEWMASHTMATLLQVIKREFRSCVVIFDLPPVLLGDDVISILPKMDAALLVAGVGTTSVADIKESQKHLQRTPVLRVVVNKATEVSRPYYAYY